MIKTMLIASILTHLLGVFIFLFSFWRKLKDDFAPDITFKIGFNILIGIGISLLFALRFFPEYYLLIAFIGAITGLFIAIFRFRIKFYEVLEAFIIAILPWLSLMFLLDSVLHSSLSSFLGFIVILILIFVSYYLDANYKKFNWYKSGKIGFTGLTILIVIFAIRLVLALFGISVLSLVNSRTEIIISITGILVFALLLYKLAVQKE